MEVGRAQQTVGTRNEKKRHGCLTAYLLFMMVSTTLGSLTYMFMSEQWLMNNDPELPSSIRRPVMVLLNLLMAICAFALWKWKKWGFWAFIAVGVGGGVLKAYFSPDHRGGLGLVAIAALLQYGVLRIGKDRQGWKQLD